MILNTDNIYRKSNKFSEKFLISLPMLSARQNISSSASSQSEINSNATVTNLLFSVPENTSENSESPYWSISRKKTVMICHLSEYNITDQSSAPFVLFTTAWRAPRGKKWLRFRSNREEFLCRKETLSPIFSEAFTLTNKSPKCERLFFSDKKCCHIETNNLYHFSIVYSRILKST